jgi:hypothetical protein
VFPVEEDENLGIHTRPDSSAKKSKRIVLATFFSSFFATLSFYSEKIDATNAREREKETDRVREKYEL